MDDHGDAVQGHDVDDGQDLGVHCRLILVQFQQPGHGGHLAGLVDQALGAVAGTRFRHGDVDARVELHVVLGKGLGDGTYGGGAVDHDLVGVGGAQEPGGQGDDEQGFEYFHFSSFRTDSRTSR